LDGTMKDYDTWKEVKERQKQNLKEEKDELETI